MKMMYKINENPYLEIEISNKSTIEYLKNLNSLLEINEFNIIKIISLNIKDKNLILNLLRKNKDILFFLPFYFNKEISDKNVLFYIDINLCIFENINELEWSFCDLVFLHYCGEEIKLSKANIDILTRKPQKKVFLILENTSYLNLEKFEKVVSFLSSIGIQFIFNTMYKSTNVIIKHPCYAYMCNGSRCHSDKSLFPRFLYQCDYLLHLKKLRNSMFSVSCYFAECVYQL